MQLPHLDIKGNLNPKWGAGHFHAKNMHGEDFEVLVAQPRSESMTSLIAWAHSLERISHPAIPIVHMISHQNTTYVSLKMNEGIQLSHLLSESESHLSRFDILSIFYQLATALQKLHSHGVTHGNINPDAILITPQGQLKLGAWTPPPIQLDFQIRKIEDLKVFQTYLYRCIVGDFPPKYRGRHRKALENMTADEERRQNAWTQWYRNEIEAEEGGLSAHKLILFEEHAQNAEDLLDSLHPHLDHYMSDMLSTMNQEIMVRLQFRDLVFQRRKLQKDLNEIQRHIRNWIATHQEEVTLCDEHINHLTSLFKDSLSYQSNLEGICGRSFERSHTVSQEGLNLGESFAQTSIYIAHTPHPQHKANAHQNHQQSLISTVLLGQQVKDLQSMWSQKEISDPFLDVIQSPSLPELQKSLNTYQSSSLYVNHMPNQSNMGEFNPLDPNLVSTFHPEVAAHDSSIPADKTPSSSAHKMNKLRSLANDLIPTQDLFDVHYERESLTDMHEGLSGFMPAQTHTSFTQLYETHASAPVPAPVEQNLDFNYKHFLIFLYLVSGLVFLWYLFTPYELQSKFQTNQEIIHTQNQKDPVPNSQYKDVLPVIAVKRSSVVSSVIVEKNSQKNKEVIHFQSTDDIQSTFIDTSIDFPMIPIGIPPAPKGMIYVSGGEVSDQLNQESHSRAVTHCMFAPSFKRKKHSKNYCNRVIKKSERANRVLKVDPFFIDRYEVSRVKYNTYCKQTSQCRSFSIDLENSQLPMTHIKMIEASDFCVFYGKRLPTYEEWLFAARGESQNLYPWGNASILEDMHYRANYSSPKRKTGREFDGHNGPHAVHLDSKLGMSKFKVAHMSGNVREWVLKLKRNQAWVTGGGWRSPLWDLRLTAGEYKHQYTYVADDIGFRCAQNIVKVDE
jgi:formylglycine-generating enzyme required for sulfatase activity/serine/threonine protein kinase